MKFSAVVSQAVYFSRNFIYTETIVSYIREQAFWSVFKVNNVEYIAVKMYTFTLLLPFLCLHYQYLKAQLKIEQTRSVLKIIYNLKSFQSV